MSCSSTHLCTRREVNQKGSMPPINTPENTTCLSLYMLAIVTTQQHARGCTMCTSGNEIGEALLKGANVAVTTHSNYPHPCHASLCYYSYRQSICSIWLRSQIQREMACKSNSKVMCGKNGGIHCVYSQDLQVWYSVLLARLGVMCKSHGRWLYILLAMLHVTHMVVLCLGYKHKWRQIKR